jgi:hypothetical protein
LFDRESRSGVSLTRESGSVVFRTRVVHSINVASEINAACTQRFMQIPTGTRLTSFKQHVTGHKP